MNKAQFVFKAVDIIGNPSQNNIRYENVVSVRDIAYGSEKLNRGDLYYIPEILNDGKKHPSEILLLAGLDEKDHYFNRFTFDGLRIHNRENGEPQKILIQNTKNLTFKNISFD